MAVWRGNCCESKGNRLCALNSWSKPSVNSNIMLRFNFHMSPSSWFSLLNLTVFSSLRNGRENWNLKLNIAKQSCKFWSERAYLSNIFSSKVTLPWKTRDHVFEIFYSFDDPVGYFINLKVWCLVREILGVVRKVFKQCFERIVDYRGFANLLRRSEKGE